MLGAVGGRLRRWGSWVHIRQRLHGWRTASLASTIQALGKAVVGDLGGSTEATVANESGFSKHSTFSFEIIIVVVIGLSISCPIRQS